MATHHCADVVIAGGGCAGLSLALAMADSGILPGLEVVILEKDSAKANDRTWCFWEKGTGKFDHLLEASWEHISIGAHGNYQLIDLSKNNYRYKLIKGEKFYDFALKRLSQISGVQILEEEVLNMSSVQGAALFQTRSGNTYSGTFGFNSLPPQLNDSKAIHLLQHFKGRWVCASEEVFDSNVATLMDFNIDQHHDCRFMYVLPIDRRNALIEYTVFSARLLTPEEYDHALEQYIFEKFPNTYFTILHEEFGVIPMSTQHFPMKHSERIWNIGTAGGQTKASTGYTFQNIQKHSFSIAQALAKNDLPPEDKSFIDKRFDWYDKTLLEVLHRGTVQGSEIFRLIFSKNEISEVFRFLSNESNIVEELRIMSSVPTAKFLPAALRSIVRSLRRS